MGGRIFWAMMALAASLCFVAGDVSAQLVGKTLSCPDYQGRQRDFMTFRSKTKGDFHIDMSAAETQGMRCDEEKTFELPVSLGRKVGLQLHCKGLADATTNYDIHYTPARAAGALRVERQFNVVTGSRLSLQPMQKPKQLFVMTYTCAGAACTGVSERVSGDCPPKPYDRRVIKGCVLR